jgi:hypothetical protein
VTAGVRFDQILPMLSEIGAGSARAPVDHRTASDELEKLAPQAPGRAAERGASVLGTAEFKGLIALLTSYILFGRKQSPDYPPLNYAKLISNSILLRTDFGSMFKKLSVAERQHYENTPDEFVALVMEACKPPNNTPPQQSLEEWSNIAVLERGVRRGYTRGTRAYNQRVNSPATRLTRGEWLTSITQGRDLLSSYHVPELASQLEGLGALGPVTDPIGEAPTETELIGERDRGQGMVMEFRNMKKDVPYPRWRDLALGIFDYIRALNER